MAHNLYNDGTKDCMFVVGKQEDAWHMLGQRCDAATTAQHAMQLAGLDWTVAKQQNWCMPTNGKKAIVAPSYSIVRSSDDAIIGTVGEGFAIRQNYQHFEFVDALLEANGGSHYDSAGALGNGATIWLSVRIPKADFSIGDDAHKAYMMFCTAHDGSLAHTAKLTDVRVVCNNTLHAALKDGEKMFRVKHTKNADSRLDSVKSLMTGVVQNAQSLRDKLNTLANRKMTRESFQNVLNKLFPAPKDENATTTRRDNVLREIAELYFDNDGNTFIEQRGTAYALLNAVTNFADHRRTARITDKRSHLTLTQARAESAVMGSGDKLKTSALAVIDEMTTDAPSVTSNTSERFTNPMNDANFTKFMQGLM